MALSTAERPIRDPQRSFVRSATCPKFHCYSGANYSTRCLSECWGFRQRIMVHFGLGFVFQNFCARRGLLPPVPLACYRVHRGALTMSGRKNITDFRQQYQIVVDRYAAKLDLQSRKEFLNLAQVSININTALASGMNGNFFHAFRALLSMISFSPRSIYRYFAYSRIIDRAVPRVWALFIGKF